MSSPARGAPAPNDAPASPGSLPSPPGLDDLECSGRGTFAAPAPLYEVGVEGLRGDVLLTARRQLEEGYRVRATDEIILAGMRDEGTAVILVLREDRLVAVVDYWREGDGWLRGDTVGCGELLRER